MNTTFKIKYILCLILFTFVGTINVFSKVDSSYSINLEVGGAITEIYNPNAAKLNIKSISRFINPSLRILWKPDHRLNLGLSSAFLQISKIDQKNMLTDFGQTDLKIRSSAIPILFLLNMEFWGLQLNGAIGTSYTYSELSAFVGKSISNKWINTFYTSLGYNLYFLNDFHLGIEGELYSFSELKSATFAIKLKLGYDILIWR